MKFIKYVLYVVSLQSEFEAISVPGCFPTKYVSEPELRQDGQVPEGNDRFRATLSEKVG